MEKFLKLSQNIHLVCYICHSLLIAQFWISFNEPPHDKTNKMFCVPGKDSDQPGHPPGLIRVFAVRMKKHWVLGYL